MDEKREGKTVIRNKREGKRGRGRLLLQIKRRGRGEREGEGEREGGGERLLFQI